MESQPPAATNGSSKSLPGSPNAIANAAPIADATAPLANLKSQTSGKVAEKAPENIRNGDFTRADLLNMKDLDVALSTRSKPSSSRHDLPPKSSEPETHAWDIDVTKIVLKSKIASGTFGTVYRALFEGKEVAVKMLDWGEDDTMSRAQLTNIRNTFKQEITVWSELDHPHITQFIGASLGSSQGFMIPSFIPNAKGEIRIGGHCCCVVVEFVPGGTLKDFLIKHRRKKLPLRTVVQLANDLATGLSYLHDRHIVHRDVKTENMLLDKRKRVKIADFGVARLEAANPKDMTGATGTLGYMAPEVLDGKPYDHTADVYSFGICLWEIYCCDMPFPDLNLKEMAAVVKNGLRPTIPGICPPALSLVMKRCWDGNPKKRPDMSQVVEMLKDVDPSLGKGMSSLEEVPSSRCFCLF